MRRLAIAAGKGRATNGDTSGRLALAPAEVVSVTGRVAPARHRGGRLSGLGWSGRERRRIAQAAAWRSGTVGCFVLPRRQRGPAPCHRSGMGRPRCSGCPEARRTQSRAGSTAHRQRQGERPVNCGRRDTSWVAAWLDVPDGGANSGVPSGPGTLPEVEYIETAAAGVARPGESAAASGRSAATRIDRSRRQVCMEKPPRRKVNRLAIAIGKGKRLVTRPAGWR